MGRYRGDLDGARSEEAMQRQLHISVSWLLHALWVFTITHLLIFSLQIAFPSVKIPSAVLLKDGPIL